MWAMSKQFDYRMYEPPKLQIWLSNWPRTPVLEATNVQVRVSDMGPILLPLKVMRRSPRQMSAAERGFNSSRKAPCCLNLEKGVLPLALVFHIESIAPWSLL
jgi:hypothetical protein